jgi:ABC transporter substrate binding protein
VQHERVLHRKGIVVSNTIGNSDRALWRVGVRRRETTRRFYTAGLILALTFSILVAPCAADAQQAKKVPRIGVLMLGSSPSAPDWRQRSRFLQELHHLGWLEGRNITIEYRWAERQVDRLPAFADELAQLPVDVIVVADTPAIRAAQQATSTIPIVMLSVGDPVAAGFASSLARRAETSRGVGQTASGLSCSQRPCPESAGWLSWSIPRLLRTRW